MTGGVLLGAAAGDVLFHVLLAMAAVIAAARALGVACRWLGQPAVIGEVVAGIALGPSLLGRAWPEGQAYLLPPAAAPGLGLVAQLGVILYMFVVGLELNAGMLRTLGRTAAVVSAAGIAVPFALGTALAVWLRPDPAYAPAGVGAGVFALFVGVSMAVTAFPVLARILADRGMTHTPLGALALASAAVGDLVAWCLLAVVVGATQARLHGAAVTVALALAYVGVMVFLVRPVAERWVARLTDPAGPSRQDLAVVFAAVLASAAATEAIGVHAIFGAFLFGAVIPHDSPLARDLIRRLDDTIAVLFLPAFFAYTGLRTQIGLVTGTEAWLVCGLITLVATAGKLAGTLAAARLCGLGWRDAASLGALMNTRGLMELIVLNVGLELGVITPQLFAMLVVMALATTAMTGPLLAALRPGPPAGGDDVPDPARGAASPTSAGAR